MDAPDSPSAFRVPKRRTSVEVLVPGGTWRRYAMFLSALSGAHGGPERVSDLLEAHEFFPVIDEPSERVTMLARSSVTAVRVEPWAEAADTAAAADPCDHAVEVLLASGLVLNGRLCFTAPAGKARVLDHLNQAPLFFVLQEAGAVALINKRHVARVELA